MDLKRGIGLPPLTRVKGLGRHQRLVSFRQQYHYIKYGIKTILSTNVDLAGCATREEHKLLLSSLAVYQTHKNAENKLLFCHNLPPMTKSI